MSLKPEIIDAMVESGCTAEQIAAVVKAAIGGRSSNAERQARYRERQRNARNACDVTERNGDARNVIPPSPSLPPQTPPSRPHPPVGSLREREDRPTDRQLFAEFDEEFWPAYPHKVGKGQAQKAWIAARRAVDLPGLMAGLGRYVADKPADRPWCNPATWLNGRRWEDQPAPAPTLRVVAGQAPPQSARDRLMETGRRMLAEERGETEQQPWQGSTIDGFAQRRQ